ncbi:MAG TPA: recombinase family protein [Candidatus Limnocylindrales bacterium]|nr:recombinase family protein [Candidatus Limnocylindrales bacterium]
MTRRRVSRRDWATKADLLAGGELVSALTYERASQDKKGQGKSVKDQRVLNHSEVARHGWRLAESFADNDRSATRYAKKERPEFELLMERIRTGTDDVLVVWEIARKERDLAVYVQIRDLCYEVGLNFWLVGGQLFDLRDKNDRMFLGFQAVQAEFQGDYIRDNVKRGIDGAAAAGRPHGKLTYGYERVYDSKTKAFLRQQSDEEVHDATGADGTTSTYTKAGIVREIFDKVASGVPLITIEEDLNHRGVPSSQGKRWLRGIIRKIAMNPAYIGKRVLRGEIVGDGQWPALVDPETFWACVRLLEDPSRTTTRAGRAVHLLSYLAKCDVCGGPLSIQRQHRQRGGTVELLSCLKKRCTSVIKQVLDEYIERIVVGWLTRPEVHEALHRTFDDQGVAQARAEAEQLRAELEQWRQMAEARQVTPVSFARMETKLLADIDRAEARAKDAALPPVLRGWLGPHAAADWARLDGVAVKREIIREILDVRLLPYDSANPAFGMHRLRLRWWWEQDQSGGGEAVTAAKPAKPATQRKPTKARAAAAAA